MRFSFAFNYVLSLLLVKSSDDFFLFLFISSYPFFFQIHYFNYFHFKKILYLVTSVSQTRLQVYYWHSKKVLPVKGLRRRYLPLVLVVVVRGKNRNYIECLRIPVTGKRPHFHNANIKAKKKTYIMIVANNSTLNSIQKSSLQ